MAKQILRPATPKDAWQLKARPGSAFLGGGTRLNASTSESFETLISLENLGLGTITRKEEGCAIGASVTLQQAVECAGIPPAVRTALSLTASRTLRNMATIGGELAARPMDSALVPVLIALDATVRVFAKKTPLKAEEFLKRADDSLVLEIVIPDGKCPCDVRFFSRTSHSPRSLVACVSLGAAEKGRVAARVVVSDCQGQVLRLAGVEDSLGTGLAEKARLEELVKTDFAPKGDIHASASFKRYMAGVLVADAVLSLRQGVAS